MADFDNFDYDIKSRMPEWWKEDALARPVNEYTQKLISEILEGLLTTMGVVQPLNVWKTIPEEYDWFHHYQELDEYLEYDKDGIHEKTPVSTFFSNSKTTAYLPNTKRKCDAKIHLKLLGFNDIKSKKDTISELKITNGIQEIILKDVSKVSTIDINTKNNQILIDGEDNPEMVTGSFKKIQPNIKDKTYSNLSIEDENKETKIVFESSDSVKFDLQIYLLKPTYTTEQNIRIATVSAFPIEWVRLYGYFCHPFNNKEGYKFLWEKKYDINSRTVYDRITKQYDCERFYIQVKFHGIGVPLMKGFPQSKYDSNPAFLPNPNLDRWGKVYGLPRREYRTDISEDEEPYTFPKYYNYPIEQDFWYEERMVNEYRFDDEAINSYFVKDDDLNNVARLECISPFTNEVWVYTETIDADSDIQREVKDILLHDINEADGSNDGVEIKDLHLIKSNHTGDFTYIDPQNDEVLKSNNPTYKTKLYKCTFCLSQYIDKIPKDIEITGIELKFKATTNLHSNSLRLSDESCMLLPFYSNIYDEFSLEKISIANEGKYWLREKDYYTIGSPNYLFGQEQITREQLLNGNNGKLEFEIGFINESDFLQAQLLIEDITLNIYYKTIKDDYNIKATLSSGEMIIGKREECNLQINISNKSKKEIGDKDLFIILPPELKFKNGVNCYKFNLEVDENLTIPNPPESITIAPVITNGEIKTGYFDILIFCEDTVINKEVLVRHEI